MTPAKILFDASKYLVITSIALFLLCGTIRLCDAYDLTNRVKEYTLENGLKVLIVERHAGPTVSLYISHPTGAIDDETGHTGTAHFLEHLRFKGTETIGTRNFREEKRILRKIHEMGSALDREEMKGDNADRQRVQELRQRLEALQTEAGKWSIPGETDRLYTENGGGGS